MAKRFQWSLFAAFIALVLGVCIVAELKQAKIHNRARSAETNSQNHQSGNSAAVLGDRKQPDKRDQETAWYNTFLNHPTDWLLVLFNGVLAAFTIRLFYATSGLAAETAGLRSAADKQAADMQASIKASVELAQSAITANQISVTNTQQQLRAYVTAFDVSVVQHRLPSTYAASGREIPGRVHTYEFAAILKNGGQTPALNVRTNISLRRFEGAVPADFDFPSSDLFGHGVIGPQIEWHTRYQVASAGLIDDVGPMILLWGWVEYDDIFVRKGGIKNRTEFCYRVDRRHVPVTNELWMGFIPYERFNAIDWDCLRPVDPATGEGGG